MYSCPAASPVKSRLLYSSAVLILYKRALPQWTGQTVLKKVRAPVRVAGKSDSGERADAPFPWRRSSPSDSSRPRTRARSPPPGSTRNSARSRPLLLRLLAPTAPRDLRRRAGPRRRSQSRRLSLRGRRGRVGDGSLCDLRASANDASVLYAMSCRLSKEDSGRTQEGLIATENERLQRMECTSTSNHPPCTIPRPPQLSDVREPEAGARCQADTRDHPPLAPHTLTNRDREGGGKAPRRSSQPHKMRIQA